MKDILKAVELVDDDFTLGIDIEDFTTLEIDEVKVNKQNHEKVSNFLRRLADKIDNKYIEGE